MRTAPILIAAALLFPMPAWATYNFSTIDASIADAALSSNRTNAEGDFVGVTCGDTCPSSASRSARAFVSTGRRRCGVALVG